MTPLDPPRPIPQLVAPDPDTPELMEDPLRDERGVTHHRGIIYAQEIGYRPLRMDLMVPESTAPVPVVVWMHGGGFMFGSRRRSPLSGPAWDALLAAGIAVAAIEYRFSFEARFPAPLHDVKAAVRWLRKHGPALGVRDDLIASWGESAGGYLSVFLALGGDDPALDGAVGVTGPSSEVATAVAWYPPTDFLHMDEQTEHESHRPHDAPGSPESILVGGPIQEYPVETETASPLSYVPGSCAAPMLVMHGAEDLIVPSLQSVIFTDALRATGADVELEIVPGAGHLFVDVDHAPLIERAVAYLADHLGVTTVAATD